MTFLVGQRGSCVFDLCVKENICEYVEEWSLSGDRRDSSSTSTEPSEKSTELGGTFWLSGASSVPSSLIERSSMLKFSWGPSKAQ